MTLAGDGTALGGLAVGHARVYRVIDFVHAAEHACREAVSIAGIGFL